MVDIYDQLIRRRQAVLKHERPLALLHWIWRKVSPEDRLRFLVEMLTTNERRALQIGFEDEEPSP